MCALISNLKAQDDATDPNADFKRNINSLSSMSYKDSDINFSAQNIEYNFKDETITATGMVTITSEDSTITADMLFYNSKEDILYVKGNVVFTNKYGHKIYSDEAVLDPKLNTGLIEQFRIAFADGSTLWAERVSRVNENTYTLHDMCFTACSVVENYTPTWTLRANKAIYNQEKGTINLYSAWFNVKGIPILWTPYFSFSNLDFVRKAGFLTPSYENNSIYGQSIIVPFYIPLGDHQDMTLKTQLFFTSNTLYSLDYNGEIENGSFGSHFSFVDSQKDKAEIDKNKRWSAFFDLNKNLTDIWRGNIKVEEASDNSYLRMYNITVKNAAESFYTNKIQLEGFFSNNSYYNTYVANYKTINPTFIEADGGITNDLNNIFYMNYSYLSEYSDFGRVNFFINTENLFTKDFYNLIRVVGNLTYKYYLPTTFGNYSFDSLIQGVDYSDALSQKKFVEDNTALSAAAAATVEYPVLFATDNVIYSVSPIAQVAYSNNIDRNKNTFLLDSNNVNVNSSNLFDLNHFQGFDQFEESKDVKYALKFSLLNNSNQGSRVFIGQMFRIGLQDDLLGNINNRSASNYFVSAYLYPLNNVYISYNGLLDKEFKQVETSIGAGYSNNLFSVGSNFEEYTQLDSTLFGTERISELTVYGNFNIHKNFKINATYVYDVSPSSFVIAPASKMALKSTNFNATWVDECVELVVYNYRDFLSTSNASTWGFRINIKSIDNYKIS
ncbi:MAG: LPS assembly protein LptD, partial [Alphaproteobacteria bacterium]|nr:LPS assembly protein LptD [Alphaproteobacteria bacterium]